MADTLTATIETPCCAAGVEEVTVGRPHVTEASTVIRCCQCGREFVVRLILRRLGSDDSFTLAGRPRSEVSS